MKSALLLALLVLSVSAVQLKVTLNVFSGGEDPSWTLSGSQVTHILPLLRASQSPIYRPWPIHSLGYQGFVVKTSNMEQYVVYGDEDLEMLLLESASDNVPNDVIEHCFDRIMTRPAEAPELPDGWNIEPANQHCVPPVRGPDNETKWDVQHDDCGFFVSHQWENNCYNYGTDVATNTYAQPGRGTGRKWSANTCEDIRASAERDGLVWYGRELPQGEPAIGHYISLHIWPDRNFHWVRKDSNIPRHWSHKPGATAVRDVDNNWKKITDPSKCDMRPWSVWCGYMIVVPSNITIN